MSKENKNVKFINKILDIDDSYKAPEKLMDILFDKEKREKIFMKMLEHYNYDVDYDWFNEYFQEEHADRKRKNKILHQSQYVNYFPNYLNVIKIMAYIMNVVLELEVY